MTSKSWGLTKITAWMELVKNFTQKSLQVYKETWAGWGERVCLCSWSALSPELAPQPVWAKSTGKRSEREKVFEEVLFQNQETYEPESCPSRQLLLHSKMNSSQIRTILKINMLASNTSDSSHLPSLQK